MTPYLLWLCILVTFAENVSCSSKTILKWLRWFLIYSVPVLAELTVSSGGLEKLYYFILKGVWYPKVCRCS